MTLIKTKTDIGCLQFSYIFKAGESVLFFGFLKMTLFKISKPSLILKLMFQFQPKSA